MKRREFVRSILGSCVVGLGGIGAYQWYQQSQLDYEKLYDGQIPLEFLNQDDLLLLSVLIPVFAAGQPLQPNFNKIIANIDGALVRLSLKNQQELRELFDILATALGRMLVAGVWQNWQQVSQGSLNEFLLDWREHPLNLLQQGYVGLQQIILGAIYAEADSWQAIGYPGPPQFNR